MLDGLIMGFSISLSLQNILYCFIGCTLGTMIGVLPGLGPTATIAMLLTVTYKLDLISAVIMLSGIYYGAQYGGTITSVLINIPGEASSVVTCIDGYKMALQGKAGRALGIAAFGSFLAGTCGTLALSLLAPPLSRFALMFGPAEYAALVILGLTLVMYLGSGSPVKAMLMGALGLAVGTIGMDPATAVERFTFGSQSLIEGVNMAVLAMGLFGIGEVLFMAESAGARASRDSIKYSSRLKDLLPDRGDWRVSLKPIGRGTLLGFFLGILPGGGAVISSFASYAMEKRLSKHPEQFGKGAIEGVAGPESANNSAVNGAFIPLLTLGIPSNVVMALLIGAFMLHGVTPGPFILKEHPQVFWGLITSMYVGNAVLLILNVPLIRFFVKIIEVPFAVLSPLIVLVCVIGAYSLNNNATDIVIMVVFGVVGYLMRKFAYEPAPFMLGFVLGEMLEKAIRQSLVISQGSPMIFFTRPISMILMAATLLMVVSPVLTGFLRRRRRGSSPKKAREAVTPKED
ncbi:MAG: tripartite tricarboxylate transporter permease [Desulfobacterota bacterium]|jgi:putative tricarboxylic transport membrane protein|nr:tripartite tricarboxylate transporter permease [Thermodesulfobacteriota bacterium]